MNEEKVETFDFTRILLPEEFEWNYLLEVAFRTSIMFMLILLFLKLSGKRSVKQLSFFELAIVVGLGSAAGDPMFYHDVPMLPAILVFVTIFIMYKILTYVTKVSEKAEKIIEGKPEKLIEDDLMLVDNLDTDDISRDEFFAFLRIKSVEHLGQIQSVYLEVNGELSVYFYEDEEVRHGLHILPDVLITCTEDIRVSGYNSCTYCGYTAMYKADETPTCPNCAQRKWLPSVATRRKA